MSGWIVNILSHRKVRLGMKYVAIINTDEPLTEQAIQFIKDTIFFGDSEAPYVFEIEDIKAESEE